MTLDLMFTPSFIIDQDQIFYFSRFWILASGYLAIEYLIEGKKLKSLANALINNAMVVEDGLT